MKPSELINFLSFAIANNFPLLIKGKPGSVKIDMFTQAAATANADLIISHPVVSDPTDDKGLPFAVNGQAEFLPFGELNKIIKADKPTVFFLDDLGQAPASVQAACMQLILARRINGHTVSKFVTFLAATNRREDRAAVNGLLEPVKSRFASIIELTVDTNDWVVWALQNGMPTELISFIRFRPELLDKFVPTKDIINTPSPRTVAAIGKLQNAGLPSALQFDVFSGAAGEAFAVEYSSFLKYFNDLPTVDQIILNPNGTPVPSEPSTLYAITGAITNRLNDQNIGPIIQYLDRLPGEYQIVTMKDASVRNKSITNSRSFIEWATKNANDLLI